MKILEVLDSYYPNTDGPNNVITFYAENLNKIDGVSAEIFVPSAKNYVDATAISIHRIKSLPAVEGYRMAVARFDRQLKKYLKNTKVDIIHIHSPFMMGRYFCNWGKKHKVPVVYTFHTAFKEDFDRVLKRNWQRKIAMNYIMTTINNADCVLTVSNGAGEVLKSYGCKKPIEVIRNGTDYNYPQNAQELIEIVNKKHNLTNNETVFLSVGRIVENKKLDLAIDALNAVKKQDKKFKFIIVGGGPYLDTLKQKVKNLDMENEIIFTGRLPERDDIVPYFLRANLLLFPSTFDTASLAPIEAGAHKLPTLLTRGSNTAEIIVENQNGFLADDNTLSWTTKLCELLDNPQLMENMRETCYKEIYKPWSKVVDEVYQKYFEVIENYKNKKVEKNLDKENHV